MKDKIPGIPGTDRAASPSTAHPQIRSLDLAQKDTADVSLAYCGWEYCTPLHRFGPNRRTEYLLHIVLDGAGTLEMGGQVITLHKNEAFLIPAGQTAWYEADRERPWVYLWLGFTGLRAAECADKAGFSMRKPVRRVGCAEAVRRYVEQMMEAGQKTYADTLRRNALLSLCLSLLIEETEREAGGAAGRTDGGPDGNVYVREAIEYMTKNYPRRIRIGALAQEIGIHRSHLAAVFLRNVGLSPQDFLLRLRMERARFLLTQTDMAVQDAAAAVGYDDPLAFSRAFRRYSGKSPSTYRTQAAAQTERSANRFITRRQQTERQPTRA